MIPIFMYHQVAEISRELDPLGLAIPPAQFEGQMSFLARKGFSCLTLPQAIEYLQSAGRAPARSFVLTFDDGYQDVHLNACPILEKFGFTATVFLVANQLGSVSNWWGKDGERSDTLMSLGEARDLVSRGFIMGSHSLSHPFLNSLDDQSALNEIRTSKLLLEGKLDSQVDFFSYPYSDASARLEDMVESAGYKAACAGDMGHWSLFNLWRVPCLRGDSLISFTFKAYGWYGKRTTLRESALGLIIRRYARTFKRWVKKGHHFSGDIAVRKYHEDFKD